MRGWPDIAGSLVLVYGSSLLIGTVASAEKIQLKNGQQFDGQLIQKDSERVVFSVPRSEVATINGHALPAPLTAGAKAPDFMATDLQGASHTLSQNNGQPTLVQFWASWCPHCRSDVKRLKELSANTTPHGLRVLTISVDDKLEDVKALIEKEHITYPVIFAKNYPTLPDLFETQGIPAYFLIDAKGMIVKTWSGSVTEGYNTDFETEVNNVLGVPPPLVAAPKA